MTTNRDGKAPVFEQEPISVEPEAREPRRYGRRKRRCAVDVVDFMTSSEGWRLSFGIGLMSNDDEQAPRRRGIRRDHG